MEFPKEWDSWSVEQQLAWARRGLAELAASDAENKGVRVAALNGLARSYIAERPQSRPKDGETDAARTAEYTDDYLIAVAAEVTEQLRARGIDPATGKRTQ